MTKSNTLASIIETYTEEEFLDEKDQPDTAVNGTKSAAIITFHADEEHSANATRRQVKRAFHATGHGKRPTDALTNARRIFRQGKNW